MIGTDEYDTCEDFQRSRDILEEHVYLNVVRVKRKLEQAYVDLCDKDSVTHRQYNVLRILYVRGRLPTSEIARRRVIRSPDITRLLNRMEDKDVIDRELSREDRRVQLAKLTQKGKETCEHIDEALVPLHKKQMKNLSEDELAALNQLLVELLGPAENNSKKICLKRFLPVDIRFRRIHFDRGVWENEPGARSSEGFRPRGSRPVLPGYL